MKAIFCLLVAAAFLSGCSSAPSRDEARLHVGSYPEGAMITVPGASGKAPAAWTWTLPKGQLQISQLVTARWVSGATASQRVNLAGGSDYEIVISRPNVPGAEIDSRYAIEQQRQSDQSALEFSNALNSAVQSAAPKPTVNCTSTRLGNTVDTSCY